jgi:circadian clock protein KaiC
VDVHFINLAEEVLDPNLGTLLERITREVEQRNPAIVVVDSFATIVRTAESPGMSAVDLQSFVQRLALWLTSWETTSFLLGNFEQEASNPVFTVADGAIWLYNEVERNSSVRKLRVSKVRGQRAMSGLHTMQISDDGVVVFPRVLESRSAAPAAGHGARLSVGVPALDEMMGGGIPAGDSIMVSGPTGSGKSILATQFVAEGYQRGECAVIAVFEEDPNAYIRRAVNLGLPLAEMVAAGKLEVMYLTPIDLSVDETLQEIRLRINRLGATRVVIDSMSGFEVALAPTFRQDFREAYYRLLRAITSLGITVMSTVEVWESEYLRFAPFNVSFLADDIVAMRYIELHGELKKVLSVIKMRSSAHSTELRQYDLTAGGMKIGGALRDYRGIITGIPQRDG